MRTILGIVMLIEAATFVAGAVLHAGVPLGTMAEPRIIPATIVESICGMALLWGGAALLFRQKRARLAAIITHAVAISGVLLGIAALALGAGPHTASNDLYHRTVLVFLAAGLFFLLSRGGRTITGEG